MKAEGNIQSEIKLISGDGFVIKAGKEVQPVINEFTLQPDEILVANGDAKFIFVKDGIEQVINQPCPTCTMVTPEGIQSADLNEKIAFNYEGMGNASFDPNNIDAIQSAILQGQDPTLLFEPTAAGNESAGNVGINGSSSAASFVSINYDNDSMLAEAGFDTAYDPNQARNELDPLVIVQPDGGESASLVVTEGDLGDKTYPVSSSTSVLVEASTLPLDPQSFVFDPLTVNTLLTELSRDITSGGQAVTFIYDTQANAIIGTLDGKQVMSIALEATSINGRDVTVTVTTTINQPIDHAGNNTDGYVVHNGDQINIDVAIQAQDSSGNSLEKPVNVDIGVIDGANPEFGTDKGTYIDEATESGKTISGDVPLDLGSDAIASIRFNGEQAGLSNITSDGKPTSFSINSEGNELTILNSDNEPVMVVTMAKDGSYTVTLTGVIDQDTNDLTTINLDVTATDKDGDTANGQVNIFVKDGADAAGGEVVSITLTEGDRDVDGSGTSTGGADTTYPVVKTGELTLVAGEDRLDPNTVAIDASQQAALIKELNTELTSGGQALTFTIDANGNLIGTIAGTDTVAVRVELTPKQDGQNVNVEIKIIQELPLDHNASGNSDGFVTVNGNDISIKVPVQAQDVEGDALDNAANIDITIVDGANPEFGTDKGVVINESTDANKTINGQIPLDVGSDDIAHIHFNAEQAGLADITSNGEKTTFTVDGNVLTVLDSNSNPVMVVTIANDGTYTVKVTGPVDQKSEDLANIKLDVTATDKDGDTAQGELNITIKDGTDAAGGENVHITLTEGDRDVDGSGTSTGGDDTTYPVVKTGELTLVAGEDRLDPTTVTIDASQQAALINELNTELTSGGKALVFTVDANGNLIGTIEGTNTVAVRVELTPKQDGQNVSVEIKIIQELPLDHNGSVNGTYVSVNGDDISIKVPVQAQDTDGDPLENAATVDITIVDGANPEFGKDEGITIDESKDLNKVMNGQIPLDVGSDDIQSIHFNAEQADLANITSNGEKTTFTVEGNVLTVLDSHSNPVMVVTIANDGTYTVKVTGPVDQKSEDLANIKLDVTATDKDGDKAQGELNINILDGKDAAGGENVHITLTEGDRDVDGSGTSTGGDDTTYPVVKIGELTLVAGEDRLDPNSVAIDASKQADLIKELNTELTSGGKALVFTVDANGNLIGTIEGTDTVAVRVELTPKQDGQNVNVEIKIIQELPLDHNASGNSDGFVTVNGNDISIKVPVQAKDTDGDPLDNAATVDITIVDGANPEFGTDKGVVINESTDADKTINGQIPLDVGSDDIAHIHFNADQSDLANITSNGEKTTFTVDGNVLTVLDSQSNPVMVVTIANDGTYTVKVTGPVDQNSADIANIKLDVTATDKDGDTAQGKLDITIKDGTNAAGGENVHITLTEGDRDVDGSGTSTGGDDTTYPVVKTGELTLVAGEDRLDPTTVTIDASQQGALINELNAELTSGGKALVFTVDANGNLIGTIEGTDTVAVRVELTPKQDGQNVNVEIKIIQELPLDHKDSGNGTYVSVDGDNISIKVPVQAQDTDGDPLKHSATVDITIVDGANPEFGTDTGITIDESKDVNKVMNGHIPLDVGSDDIQSIHFNAEQTDLANITSNGEKTTFTVEGNVLTVLDSQSNPVMVVTIANDGTYTVKVTGPVDQNSEDLANIKLDVTATDKDGDTAKGELNITIKDGNDAAGGEKVTITLTEGDRDVDGNGTSTDGADTTYPVEKTGELTLVAGEDRLIANSVAIDASKQADLIQELNTELTSGGQALTFSVDANGNLIGTIAGTDTVAVRVELTSKQDGQNVNVEIKIIQELPLDHKESGNGKGFVTVNGNDISINVPVQAQDTDGDSLEKPAIVDITIVDGANPEFGKDPGTTITETETGATASGKIPLDVGSDDIAHIDFADDQPSLKGIMSNNQATRYVVDGNEIKVVIDGGANDGAPVMTIEINIDGSYTVHQYLPIEQDNSKGDTVDINLAVTATDKDGDVSNTGQLEIHIKDGLNPTGEGVVANITITEGDLEDPKAGKGYPVSADMHFTVNATDDALVANSLKIADSAQADLVKELNGLTSNGEALNFTVHTDANGVITITGVTASGQEAVSITMTPSSLANGDVTVDLAIKQSLPLDHLNADGKYIDVTDGKITINVPVQMQDADGDSLEKPVDVNITIEDGQNPSFGHDSTATVEEGASGHGTASGTIDIDTGSDQVAKVYFTDQQSSLDGLTSNGHATTYSLSPDGSTITVVLKDNPSQVVMEIKIDVNGHYAVEQQQPIDQVDDTAKDNEVIKLDVIAQDYDGDKSNPGQITINIHDGEDAKGGETGSIVITEGDLQPTAGEQGYPVTGDVTIAVKAGVDRLDPNTVTISDKYLTDLINELQSELTASGAKIHFEYQDGQLVGISEYGEKVLTVTVSAEQAANGHDVDVKVSITQHVPLDHSGTNNDGFVSVDGDKIVIDVPVQVKDTDGDNLANDVNAQITINDGAAPVIISAPALSVDEDALADGSHTSPDGITANGTINVDQGSDYVADFKVDVKAFNEQNSIKSEGHDVVLKEVGPGTYQGMANGQVVFTYTLLPNGRYIFDLKGTIDHPTQGEDEFKIEFPVYAVDRDGDTSGTVNIDVSIKDDIPSVHDVTLNTVEHSTTTLENVIVNTGADGAHVTALIVDGQHIDLSTLPESGGYRIYEVTDNGQKLGDLMIKPNGETYFAANDNLDHNQEEIIKKIGFEVTDGDGDKAQGTITLEVSDKDATLSLQNSTGQEEDGRHSTDPNDNVDVNRDGIAINMSINVGDNDRGEHIGTVTIHPQGEAHGVFMFNGQPLAVNSDGSITIPASAFKADASGENYTLQGITFVPAEDFSTSANGIKFDVSAQVNTDDGGNHPVMNGEFSINVQGIADTPTWNASSVDHYVVDEDGSNVQLSVVADLQDTDGSEALFYYITVPKEYQDKCTLEIDGKTLVETSPGSGIYKVDAEQMKSVEVNPADNFSGDIKLSITAESKELDNFVDGHQTAESTAKEIVINVNPQADDGTLKVTRVESKEDERIDLSTHINFVSLDDNTDNSEHLFLQISALPEGAVLYLNDHILTPNADGVYEIKYEDLNGLSLQPPLDSNVDFSISVKGVIRDVATITDANGNVTTETSEKVVGPQSIDIALTGVVDTPVIESDNPDWKPLEDGKIGLETTIKEDGSAKFDFKVVSGEHTVDGKTDGSETLSIVVSGIPEGAKLYDQNGNLQTLVYAGEDKNGQPIYQVNLTTLNDVKIVPPENSTEDITLDVRVVVTENDGASKAFNGELVIHVTPEIDATDYGTVSKGFEDQPIQIDWLPPEFTDPKEHITAVALNGLPQGYQLFLGDTLLVADASGKITFTDSQLQQLLNGTKLTLHAPEDSDKDITLTSTVTVSETDVDGDKETVTKDITGTLTVDIEAVVESDGQLVVSDDGKTVTNISCDSDGVIDLSNGADSDGKITWVNDDKSSSEVIQQVVLEPIPEGFVIVGGINNGDGSWTIPQSQLGNLQIKAPEGFKETLVLQISAMVQDLSDDGDPSALVVKKDTITLDFSKNTESHDEKAADIIIEDHVVTGTEDHTVDLGKQITDHILKVSTADGHQLNDELTIVIDAKNLPDGASISGADYNHVTGEYVLKVPVSANGEVDLSSIHINLPKDFAGDFKLDVKFVTTDTESGDYKTQTDTISVQIAPEVDGPKSVEINVVETEGLNGDKQPISSSDDKTEQVYKDVAYEDGDIKLDLSVALKDVSTELTDGKESVESVTLTLKDSADGVFIDANGNVLGSSITIDASQMGNIHFRPAPDFSGKVDIDVKTTVVDTTVYDETAGGKEVSASKTFDNTVSFEVVAVNDDIKWHGIDKPIIGNEDTAISLSGVGGSLQDSDGSEHIVSIKLENVPDGFIVQGAVNNGNGVWTITASGETFDLSNVKVEPPKDFSGKVDIDIVVYSKEETLDKPAENRETITIDVQPVADKVDTDVNPNASGDENGSITLDLGIKAYDDENTVKHPGSNVHENGAESLQITITNVPDSSSFTLPDGVKGSCEKQADGSWIIKVDGSELDKLIFHPGDANNQTVIDGKVWTGDLDFDIRAVDNGVVGTDSVAVDKTIHVDVTPDNDAPVNHMPTDPLTVEEDTTLVIKNLQVTDVDSNDHNAVMNMTVTLSVQHGQLSIADGVDTTGLVIKGNGDGTLTIEGDITKINQLLDKGINYVGDKDFNGTDSLTMTTNDNGNSGAGGALTDTDSVDITVTPVNDAPVNTVPDAFTVDEDSSHVISGLKISDVDAKENGASGDMTVTLAVSHGQLAIIATDTQGLNITDNGDGKLVISGDINKINALLADGIKYTGDENYAGKDQLTMTTSDNGNAGAGGVLTDTDTVDITVTPVNDAPVNHVPTSITADEDVATVITGLQVSDVDFNELPNNTGMSVQLSVAHGSLTITLPENSPVKVVQNGAGNVTLEGSMDDINAVLNSGVSYTGDENYSGKDELTITTNDGGNTGSGGNQAATSKVEINVAPKADAPSLSISPEHLQTAAIRSSVGTMLPLIGLIAAASADASETLTVKLTNLGSGQVVDKDGNVIGKDLGNGNWEVPADKVDGLYIKDLDQGTHSINVVAVSTESDGSYAESAPVNINVVVDDLSQTNNVIGNNSNVDGDNLIIDSTAAATLYGGDGDDVLVGGLGSDILVGGAGDDILWGGELGGHGDGVKDTFLWTASDFGTADAPATDKIMDFEVGIDTISLGDALDTKDIHSLADLNNRLNITEQDGSTLIQISNDQDKVVQNIILDGVTNHDLFGSTSSEMTATDKVTTLLNNGSLELSKNFGNEESNDLIADNQGESLFGFDGDDTLVAGQGSDILTGGAGDDLFTWHETSLSSDKPNADTIADFELGKDKIDIRELLSNEGDDSQSDMDNLLKHVSAGVDDKGNVELDITTDDGKQQNIVLDNINPVHDLGLMDGASSADIVNSLFDHNAFKLDNTH